MFHAAQKKVFLSFPQYCQESLVTASLDNTGLPPLKFLSFNCLKISSHFILLTFAVKTLLLDDK